MKNITEKIYEEYLKPREKNYSISDDETRLLKCRVEFENDLSLKQRLKFEEFDFLMSKMKHTENLDLIDFVIKYLNKKEDN